MLWTHQSMESKKLNFNLRKIKFEKHETRLMFTSQIWVLFIICKPSIFTWNFKRNNQVLWKEVYYIIMVHTFFAFLKGYLPCPHALTVREISCREHSWLDSRCQSHGCAKQTEVLFIRSLSHPWDLGEMAAADGIFLSQRLIK